MLLECYRPSLALMLKRRKALLTSSMGGSPLVRVEHGKYESHKVQADHKHCEAQWQIKEGIEKLIGL